MASANLDLVRSVYAAWARGDYRSAEWAAPEIECVFADGLSRFGGRGKRSGLKLRTKGAVLFDLDLASQD
jgi:hypothetical protein